MPDTPGSPLTENDEQVYIETLLVRREAGEVLTDSELAAIAYSPFGTAAGCGCTARSLRGFPASRFA